MIFIRERGDKKPDLKPSYCPILRKEEDAT
jgi:hypothetical protein